MVNLCVDLGKGLRLQNPVLTASGTFGYGYEYDDFFDISKIGGFIVKGTTFTPREGNAYPRFAETPSGMLNAVGLQNKGVDFFCNEIYPKLVKYSNNVIVNVSGSSIDDYVKAASKINQLEHIPAIELNISCPNVKQGGMAFGTDRTQAARVVEAVRSVYNKHLMVKLTPNVSDIVSVAKAVESAGANSVSLINTLLGMAIDAEKQSPVLSTVTGGLSGPCVKPIALRMVWQVSNAVSIPVVGLGGICNATDAVEFILAGAKAIQIGTANFLDPTTPIKVVNGLCDYLTRHGVEDVNELIGGLKM